MNCVVCAEELGGEAEALYDDPRTPPVADPRKGPCLCPAHFVEAAEERIEEMQEELTALRKGRRKARRRAL